MPLPMSHHIPQGHICIFQSGGGLVEELEDKNVCSEAFQLSVGKHWEVTQHYTLEDSPPKYGEHDYGSLGSWKPEEGIQQVIKPLCR